MCCVDVCWVWVWVWLAVEKLAKLSWIPVATRMRILKREMDVLKVNSDASERLEADRLAVRVPVLLYADARKATGRACRHQVDCVR